MKDPRALAFLIAGSILFVAILIFNGILLRQRAQSKTQVENAVSRLMKRYKVITLPRISAIITIGKLNDEKMKDVSFEVYETLNDPESFHLIIRRKSDEPVYEPRERFVVEATSDNVAEAISILSARH